MTSYAEMQLAAQGIRLNREITTSATLAPFLLRGTRFITLILEKLGRYAADEEVAIKLLPVPVGLQPVTETLIWTDRHTNDPGHQWLRDELHLLVEELEAQQQEHR